MTKWCLYAVGYLLVEKVIGCEHGFRFVCIRTDLFDERISLVTYCTMIRGKWVTS